MYVCTYSVRVLRGMLSYFNCLVFSYGWAKTIQIRYIYLLKTESLDNAILAL